MLPLQPAAPSDPGSPPSLLLEVSKRTEETTSFKVKSRRLCHGDSCTAYNSAMHLLSNSEAVRQNKNAIFRQLLLALYTAL